MRITHRINLGLGIAVALLILASMVARPAMAQVTSTAVLDTAVVLDEGTRLRLQTREEMDHDSLWQYDPQGWHPPEEDRDSIAN